jgi:hypothetical protein
MGHFILFVLHLACLIWLLPGLVITVPFHLIYAVMSSRREAASRQQAAMERQLSEMVRCSECRELVRWDAIKCKHCGAQLTPSAAPPAAPSSDDGAKAIAIAIATLFGLVLLAKACNAV